MDLIDKYKCIYILNANLSIIVLTIIYDSTIQWVQTSPTFSKIDIYEIECFKKFKF